MNFFFFVYHLSLISSLNKARLKDMRVLLSLFDYKSKTLNRNSGYQKLFFAEIFQVIVLLLKLRTVHRSRRHALFLDLDTHNIVITLNKQSNHWKHQSLPSSICVFVSVWALCSCTRGVSNKCNKCFECTGQCACASHLTLVRKCHLSSPPRDLKTSPPFLVYVGAHTHQPPLLGVSVCMCVQSKTVWSDKLEFNCLWWGYRGHMRRTDNSGVPPPQFFYSVDREECKDLCGSCHFDIQQQSV